MKLVRPGYDNRVCVGKKEIAADTAELLQGKGSQLVHPVADQVSTFGPSGSYTTCHNNHWARVEFGWP